MGLQPIVQPMHTCGCQPLINAYLYQLYLRNHWVTLHLLVSSLKCRLSFIGLFTESLDQTRLMVAPRTVHLMLAGLHRKLYVQNHWVTLHLWKRNLKCSLCWLRLRRESLGYTSVIGAAPSEETLLVTPNLYTHWVSLNLEVFSVKCSLLLLFYLKNHWITLLF